MRSIAWLPSVFLAAVACGGVVPTAVNEDSGVDVGQDAGVPDAGPTCAGCTLDGVCKVGSGAAACGSGGGACSACSDHEVCTGGRCVLTCDDTTCPTGCCRNGVCEAGTSDDACGTAGAACGACGATTGCRNQACVEMLEVTLRYFPLFAGNPCVQPLCQITKALTAEGYATYAQWVPTADSPDTFKSNPRWCELRSPTENSRVIDCTIPAACDDCSCVKPLYAGYAECSWNPPVE